jgi:hypothetical protein
MFSAGDLWQVLRRTVMRTLWRTEMSCALLFHKCGDRLCAHLSRYSLATKLGNYAAPAAIRMVTPRYRWLLEMATPKLWMC